MTEFPREELAFRLASGFRLAAPRLDRLDTESAFELEG